MTATATNPNIGKSFRIKANNGTFVMECVVWTSESRAFKCDAGYVELDWMEYLDQSSLGLIERI
jgi:hypothetical protein